MNVGGNYRTISNPVDVKVSLKEYIEKLPSYYRSLAAMVARNNNSPVPRPSVPNSKMIKLSPPKY